MKLSGEILATLAAIFLGLAIPLGAQGSKQFGTFQIAVYSSLISIVFLVPFSFIIKEKIQIKKYLTSYFKEAIQVVASRSIFGTLLYFYGVSLTTAIHSAFMFRLEPIFVIILSYIFLREKPNMKQIVIILIMIFGAFLFSTGGNINIISQTQVGDLIILFSLLFFAYSYIPTKKIGNEINSVTVTTVNNLISGLILFVIMLFLPINLITITIGNIWLLLAYVIFFYVFVLYFLFASMKKTKAWVVSSLLSLSAVVGAFIAYLWLGETMNIIQIIGATIILISSYFIVKK
jgi:drug/metabolite transporter (DMT)-like permease